MAYTADLVRFVSNIPVLNDGTIPINQIETTETFTSDLYSPVYSLSTVARMVQGLLNSGKIEVVNETLDSSTIVYKALNNDLASYAPNIYVLLRAVVLESFALLYTIENEPKNLQYMSAKDILRAKQNLNFIADYFSTETKYFHMIENLRDMNVSFGYLQNQIDVIMNERGRR
jgi:hypothetical protein